MFSILACDENLLPIVSVLKSVFKIVQIGIPILLILWGAFDLGKAVIASDEKEIKGATSKLIKRAIAAVAVFFAVTLVSLIMNLVSNSGAEESDSLSWKDCWNNA